MSTFGEIRTLLSERPSVRAWKRLCKMIDTLPVEECNQMVIPYIRHHLEISPRWERLTRNPPEHWLKRFKENKEFFPAFSIISHLHLSMYGEEITELLKLLVDSTDLNLLRMLHLETQMKNKGLLQLCEGEHLLQRLRGLNLTYNQLTAPSAEHLASLSSLEGLELLDLSHNKIKDAGVKALVESEHLRGLKWLNLTDCGCTDAAEEMIQNSDWPSSIKSNWKRW